MNASDVTEYRMNRRCVVLCNNKLLCNVTNKSSSACVCFLLICQSRSRTVGRGCPLHNRCQAAGSTTSGTTYAKNAGAHGTVREPGHQQPPDRLRRVRRINLGSAGPAKKTWEEIYSAITTSMQGQAFSATLRPRLSLSIPFGSAHERSGSVVQDLQMVDAESSATFTHVVMTSGNCTLAEVMFWKEICFELYSSVVETNKVE